MLSGGVDSGELVSASPKPVIFNDLDEVSGLGDSVDCRGCRPTTQDQGFLYLDECL